MRAFVFVLPACLIGGALLAQSYGPPDRNEPGDLMIQEYLRIETEEIEQGFVKDVATAGDWKQKRSGYMRDYLYMLGLWPMPDRTPLQAKITGTFEGDGFIVEKLHYQSRSRLYVTANLYRPAMTQPGQRLPAVLYVCGHSGRGRNGNKAAFQSHGIWFARHGYVCLIVDTLQLGEVAALHHGTYREGRWSWHSRGYTPAGVECWNGIRGIDYLLTRPDVDPARVAVTGISGGGAATFWIAAADERAKVAVPVSGMADLVSYVPNRVINGHCDCMFLYNAFQWPWTRIAALVAPRPLLFVNSDNDGIFPMDANERVINRLERLYSLYGAGDLVDSLVSVGGHDYREDIRKASFRFINLHLKHDSQVVSDSEVDLVTGSGNNLQHPILPEQLRAFPQDSDVPRDQLNSTIDEHFVPLAQVNPPERGQYEAWREKLIGELRRVAFRHFPDRVPAGILSGEAAGDTIRLRTESVIEISLQRVEALTPARVSRSRAAAPQARRIILWVQGDDEVGSLPDWLRRRRRERDIVYMCQPRGIGPTRWTRKNPPNYVDRSHVLLGRTVDSGRVWDLIAAARYLRAQAGEKAPVFLAGEKNAAIWSAYAALLEPDIAGLILNNPPVTHLDNSAPQFLNVLRVCDVPDVLGMLAPRRLSISEIDAEHLKEVRAIYAAARAARALRVSVTRSAPPGRPGRGTGDGVR